MKTTVYATIAAALMLSVAPMQASAASCSFANPLPVGPKTIPFDCPEGPQGPQGPAGADGAPGLNGTNGLDGKDGVDGVAGLDGANGLDGKDGVDGKDGLNGRDGRDFDVSEALAVSAAHPDLYLSDRENFALSTALGFADGASALGLGGTMRLDQNWSAFASGALSTDNSSNWSGRVGARVGW